MPYTLWRGEELLGESELETPTGDGRAGVFRPAPAFETVRPVFERRQALTKRWEEVQAARRPDLPPAEAMRQALQDTGVGPALVESELEVRGLGLALRDPAGAPLPGPVMIWELELPSLPDFTAEERASAEADFAEAGMRLDGPNYLLVLLPERYGRPLPQPDAPA